MVCSLCPNCALDPRVTTVCVTCKRGGDIKTRHNTLQNVVYSTLWMGTRQFQDTTSIKQNDPKCVELGWRCIQLAVESYGAWGPDASRAFSLVSTWLAIHGNTQSPR